MMPAVAGDTLYTADRSGALTAFHSGRRIWSHDLLTPDAPRAAPIVMNNVMHVTDTGGTVHSIPLR